MPPEKTATSAVILAGGLGTRLRSSVPHLPKPMAPIAGRPFLEYQLDYWIAQGVCRFVLSVGYRYEAIRDHFGTRYKGAELDYAIERQPLGTGGGFLLAAEKVGREKPFLLLNGDTYFAVDWSVLNAYAQEHEADWCIALFRAGGGGRYMGVEMSPQGRITSMKSGADQGARFANGGVYWVHPRVLEAEHFVSNRMVSLEDDVFPAALASGQRMFGLECVGTFIDIGVPEDYQRAAALLAGER
ncbi:MAG: phosphohexose mutase [Nitrospira sp.]|nr:phosphohexose mutase [Nitrospira sp.]